MIEILCFKSSITADTAFRKFYPAGVHKWQHTLDQPRKNQIKTQRGIHDKAITGFRNISGGHPIKLPATKLAGSETDSRFVWTAVNDWEPESVTGLVDTAKTCHDPKQYRCSSHNHKESSKAWYKYRIVIKPQTTLWPPVQYFEIRY